MYKYVLEEYEEGITLYVNLIDSSAGHYLNRNPYVLGLIKEAVPARPSGEVVVIEHEMGRIIGNSNVVTTSEKDTVYYAQARKKTAYGRYVKNRSMDPSSTLTLVAKQDSQGHYELVDVWIGSYTPPFPGDDSEVPESRNYWETHAVISDSEIIQTKSITKVCPY